jgi:hypothetical protein
LNIFKGDNEEWAIVGERLGFNPRAGNIMLDICYFGNCLTSLERYNGQDINYYTVYPVDLADFYATDDDEVLRTDAKFWNIRGNKIEISHTKEDYIEAGIELKEYEPGEISEEEIGRLLIMQHQDLFRATDKELYKSIPDNLKKILVLDEWYHRDFVEIIQPTMSDEQMRKTYELNKTLSEGKDFMDYESFFNLLRQQERSTNNYNQDQWQSNRPSSYETWQLLAKVIATGDPSIYKPTLKPNTHWKNWPESGSL